MIHLKRLKSFNKFVEVDDVRNGWRNVKHSQQSIQWSGIFSFKSAPFGAFECIELYSETIKNIFIQLSSSISDWNDLSLRFPIESKL